MVKPTNEAKIMQRAGEDLQAYLAMRDSVGKNTPTLSVRDRFSGRFVTSTPGVSAGTNQNSKNK